MSSKLNIFGIVYDHFKTLRNFSEGRLSPIDFTIFVVCPLFLGVVVAASGLALDSNLVNALINASAIFVGLLLNLLVLMFDQQNKAKSRLEAIECPGVRQSSGEKGNLKLRTETITEVVSNISYTILVCVLSLCSLLLLAARNNSEPGVLAILLSAMNVTLWLNIILTIVMIIKRVFILFKS